ncbi:MAG: hypothetical protein K6E40_08260 [Desulfovibrio sp.]|nr:hypothetical protein [Desulfovibrio sp.]
MADIFLRKLAFRRAQGSAAPAALAAPAGQGAFAGFSLPRLLGACQPSASRAQALRFQASGAGRASRPVCLRRNAGRG